MKKLYIFMFILLLTGCNQKSDEKIIKEVERKSTDKEYGIKFLGYGNYFIEKEVEKYLTDEELKKLKVILYPGDEYYLILPTDKTKSVRIHNIEDNGKLGFVYRAGSNGGPVLLRTNVSDIRPNTNIMIDNGNANGVSFEPFVSLKDGSVTLTNDAYELTETFKHNISKEKIKTKNYSIEVPKIFNTKINNNKITVYNNNKKIIMVLDVVKEANNRDVLTGLIIDGEQKYLVYEQFNDEYIGSILLSTKILDGEINNKIPEVNYGLLLEEVLGTLKGKVIIEEEDVIVNDNLMKSFSVGTNLDGKVTKENFYAFRNDNLVLYEYNVLSDSWDELYTFR